MQIFSPELLGKVLENEDQDGPPMPVTLHKHENMSVLENLTISEEGDLLYAGSAVGSKPQNESVLSQLGVAEDGSLTYADTPVGKQLSNASDLERLSVVDGHLLYAGQELSSGQADVYSLSGKIVDITGLSTGMSPVYDAASDTFKMQVVASAPAGSGLYVTPEFSMSPGQEVTVAHQAISNGRAMYQVDRMYPIGSPVVSNNMLLDAADKTLINTVENQADAVATLRLPYSYGTYSTQAMLATAFDQVSYLNSAYRVGEYVYNIRMMSDSVTKTNTIIRAHISNLGSWTLLADTIPVLMDPKSLNACRVFRVGEYLYQFGSSILRAHISTPTTWLVFGTPPAAYAGAIFVVGTKFYLVAGVSNYSLATPVATSDIYMSDASDLVSWTKVGSFPIAVCRQGFYQYGDYLYSIGGETVWGTANVSAIYRAELSDPTSWTQVGSFPTSVSRLGNTRCISGRIVAAGGYVSGASSPLVYSADATNPVTWTNHGNFSGGSMYAKWGVSSFIVDNIYYTVGGFYGTSSVRQHVERLTFSAVSSAGSGVVITAPIDISSAKTLASVDVLANVVASSSIKTALSEDGGDTWKYWSGTAWVSAASRDAALASGAALASPTSNHYAFPGAASKSLSGTSLLLAFSLVGAAANVTPFLYSVKVTIQGGASYSPMLITNYSNPLGEIGLICGQGSNNTTKLKNKTSDTIAVKLKVYDGYGV